MGKSVVLSALMSAVLLSACATNGVSTSAGQLSAVEKVVINAPADKVWQKIASFGDITWHPAVKESTLIKGSNNTLGAVRKVTLQDGGLLIEPLTSYSTTNMTYGYSITEGVLPFSDYAASIQVKPTSATTTEVTWTGSFKRKDTSATPTKGQDDEAATTTAHAVYRGGLDHLKKITE